jgi:hypothetical protein
VKALDAHLARTHAMLATLNGSDAPNAPQAAAQLQIESIELESDRTYLTSLIEERTALETSNAPH